MTVKSLLSSGETTTVQVEVTGLAGGLSLTAKGQPKLTLRDVAGKEYRPSGPSMAMGRAAPLVGRGSPAVLRMESTFAGLDSAVRSVEVALDGPAPVGSWRVRVPVVPLRQAGLPVPVPATR